MQSLKHQSGESRTTHANSAGNILKAAKSDRIEYKDYLNELKMRRLKDGPEDEIAKLIRTHKTKEKALMELKRKSEELELQAVQKRRNMKSVKNFQETMRKESEVDNVYMKALKAKIACL